MNAQTGIRTRIPLLILFLTAVIVSCIEAFFIDRPGTMDACYYFSGGVKIVAGQGANEFFLWNYLDDTSSIPNPSFQYWMPLTSLVSAFGMALFQGGFRQSQIAFLILGVCFPLLVYWLGKKITGSERLSILAGFFALFSGYYTIYWMNTESFLLYAWLGGLFIGLSPRLISTSRWQAFLLIGALCGLAHLTRADGVLFLLPAAFLLLFDRSLPLPKKIIRILWVAAGYLLAMGPWFARNVALWGSLFPPGTGKTLWLVEYNDMFHIPSSTIGWDRFLSAGIPSILTARWDALQANAISTVFVSGLVFLFPLLCWGLFLLRRKLEIRTAVCFFFLIFVLMTAVYPFQGSRGGFLHSSAALLPIAAVAAAAGLDDLIARLSRWRKWNPISARTFLETGIVLLSVFSSGMIFFHRVAAATPDGPFWATQNVEYSLGVSRLPDTPNDTTRFIVNNPTCFHLQTGFETVPVPAGDPSMLLEAADRYHIQYVILDGNAPKELVPLYRGEVAVPRLQRLFSDEYGGMEYVWYLVLPPP